jgi:hypothetical protein
LEQDGVFAALYKSTSNEPFKSSAEADLAIQHIDFLRGFIQQKKKSDELLLKNGQKVVSK